MRNIGNWWLCQIYKNGEWSDFGMFDTTRQVEIAVRYYGIRNNFTTISYRVRKSDCEFRKVKTLNLPF